ncbi:MAG: PIG-L family deacetylase [Bryobacteraceae bacterium]|jgi:LmbE family N-acetylglucosaminyl deacetylase
MTALLRMPARRLSTAPILALLLAAPAPAQVVRPLAGAGILEQRIEKLRVVGSLLMIAAHPDDENNRSLAYYAQGRKLRTAYLSLTRGEGGQNLIGSEQGALLGVIRTQELLMARRVDGAEQYFSRAIDFGFSKTAEETFQKWGRDAVLSDIVWRIRRFRPDVIVLSFTGTPRDGHGHHQASAILAKEAFHAAADPKRFPEQLSDAPVWQAKRLVWNTFFGRAHDMYPTAKEEVIDTGEYNPALGVSYAEIGAWSRTQHRSQGQGFPERKGSSPVSLIVVDGEPMQQDFMDGIDTTWNRLPGGAAVDVELLAALKALTPADASAAVPHLLKARALMAAIDHPDARLKLIDLDETIAQAMGLWLDVSVNENEAAPGMELKLDLTAVQRSKFAATVESAQLEGIPGAPAFPGNLPLPENEPKTAQARFTIPADQPPTQPYWLRYPAKEGLYDVRDRDLLGLAENPPVLSCRIRVGVGGQTLELIRPVENRYTDRARGELARPFVILPSVSIEVPDRLLVFPDGRPRAVEIGVRSNYDWRRGTLQLLAPAGWKVESMSPQYEMRGAGVADRMTFIVTPPAGDSSATLEAMAGLTPPNVVREGIERIQYEHIPPQTIQSPVRIHAFRADVRIAAKRIGYVMGSGDEVPEALKQLGCEVTLLGPAELEQADFAKFDAIVTGVRALNQRADLRAARTRLWEYVEGGGTVVVQYNLTDTVLTGGAEIDPRRIGPYPLTLSRDRVTVEEAPVQILDAASALLNFPNKIVPADFDGWVQERGLYFPSEWDAHYSTVIATSDPGEKPLAGGILYARYGKGVYIYTSYSWFRQLPAGVPGAWRIFANLVSAGQAPR